MKFKLKYDLSTDASTHLEVFYQKCNDNPQKSFKNKIARFDIRQTIAAYFKKAIFHIKADGKNWTNDCEQLIKSYTG